MIEASVCRATAILACALMAGACGAPKPARGIILVTLDTTRADRLGCYGYPQAKTPNLDALAQGAAVFDNAHAAVTTTLASHTTMFTGLYPPAHGVRYNGMFKVAKETRTIAELLKEAGWATGGFPASFPVTATTGLDKGFEVYQDLFQAPDAGKLPMSAERKAEEVVDLASDWIASAGDKRFFAWVHLFDPHAPYAPPFPYSAEFRDRLYDGEIAYVDAQLGRLFESLKSKGLWDDVVIVVAGDHGEGLYDHGERQHSSLVYQSTLHVPLILKAPGSKAAVRVAEPVTLADVGPTILEYAAVAIPQGLDGVGLRDSVRSGTATRRDLYFESLTGSLMFGWSPLEGLRRGKWKLIRSSAPELYDLETDPGELTNLSRGQPEIAADLTAQLEEGLLRWSRAAPSDEATAAPVDVQALARLASLGYVGGSVGAESRGGPNPAAKIHLEGELLEIRDRLAASQWREALELAHSILADDPGNRYTLYSGALAAVSLGDFTSARSLAVECNRRYPEFAPASLLLGQLAAGEGDLSGAIAIFRKGLEYTPDDPSLVYPLCLALIASGKTSDATPLLDKALLAQDAAPEFYVARALLRATAKDDAGAMAALRDALAHGYRDRETLQKEPMLAPLRAVPGFGEVIEFMANE